MKFAVQLYSLREYIEKNGLENALKIISEAGFEGVEFAGFYGMSAAEISALLKKYDLAPVSAHIGNEAFEKELPTIKALGIKAVCVPWIGFNHGADAQAEYEKTRKTLALARENGIVLGYHNHAHEFENGSDYVKGIADAVAGLKLELDVFWLAVAGIDALKYMEREKDRLLFLHVKELGADGAEGVNPIVGEGKANCGAVMEKGKALGVPWAILEAEKIGMAEADYLRESCKFMKKYQ